MPSDLLARTNGQSDKRQYTIALYCYYIQHLAGRAKRLRVIKRVALPQCSVDLLQHPRPKTELFLAQRVERSREGVEMGVEVFGVGVDVEEAGEDFALGRVRLDLGHGVDAVGGVVLGVGLAQLDNGAVVLEHFDDGAFAAVDVDGFAVGPEVGSIGSDLISA